MGNRRGSELLIVSVIGVHFDAITFPDYHNVTHAAGVLRKAISGIFHIAQAEYFFVVLRESRSTHVGKRRRAPISHTRDVNFKPIDRCSHSASEKRMVTVYRRTAIPPQSYSENSVDPPTHFRIVQMFGSILRVNLVSQFLFDVG
jgi:hypothetical protein